MYFLYLLILSLQGATNKFRERYQDCSGKSTYYRYGERQHLVSVTDALNQTTTLERKPDGEVLRITRMAPRKPSATTSTVRCSATPTARARPPA